MGRVLHKKENTFFLLTVAVVVAVGMVTMANNSVTASAPQKNNSKVKEKAPSFLFLSDIHLNDTASVTKPGGDTGHDLWKIFREKVEEILAGPDSPDFIIYTGDLSAHYTCMGGCYLGPGQRTSHNTDLTAVLSVFHQLSDKYHKSFFYLPGNNDAIAGNYYSFADEKQQTALGLVQAADLFYPSAGVDMGRGATKMISYPEPFMGFYSAQLINGLRIIALNTVIYTQKFTAVDGTTRQADGDLQMKWLEEQLALAAESHEKVYIAMHVPPGVNAYDGTNMWVGPGGGRTSWQNIFLRLTDKYQPTIAGILYGHTHMDEVRRLYDSTGRRITEVAISCPGLTPNHYNNPGFKTVRYDVVSKELLDFTTYYTKLGKRSWGDSTYSFSKTFGQGISIHQQLSGMPLNDVGNCMSRIFTVRALPALYNTTRSIEVKWQ